MDVITELTDNHRHYSKLMSNFEQDYASLKKGDYYSLLRMKKALYALKLDMEVHFAREEYALFSNVEHPIIHTLATEHTLLREKFGDMDISIVAMEGEELKKEKDKINELRGVIDTFRALKASHISKEETILFPHLRENITIKQLEFIQYKLEEFDNIVAVNLL